MKKTKSNEYGSLIPFVIWTTYPISDYKKFLRRIWIATLTNATFSTKLFTFKNSYQATVKNCSNLKVLSLVATAAASGKGAMTFCCTSKRQTTICQKQHGGELWYKGMLYTICLIEASSNTSMHKQVYHITTLSNCQLAIWLSVDCHSIGKVWLPSLWLPP